MKAKYYLVGSLVFLALLTAAWAADVTGQWKAEIQGANITINLKMEGQTLTGTLDNSLAGPTDIKDGKIDGDAVSFYVVRMLGENETKVMWKGTVAGDEIKFTRQAQGGAGNPDAIVAKRVK